MTRRWALLLSAMGLCAGCGDGSSSSVVARLPTAPTTPLAVGDYQGTWTGMTNQSERFSFTVSGNFVSHLEFSVNYHDVSCNGGLGAGQGLGSSVPISN